MLKSFAHVKCFFMLALCTASVLGQKMPPPADQKLAKEIYKEMIEINSSVMTSTTTPVVQAVAKRLRAEGFPVRHFSRRPGSG